MHSQAVGHFDNAVRHQARYMVCDVHRFAAIGLQGFGGDINAGHWITGAVSEVGVSAVGVLPG